MGLSTLCHLEIIFIVSLHQYAIFYGKNILAHTGYFANYRIGGTLPIPHYEYLKKEVLFSSLAYVQEHRWAEPAEVPILRKVIERQIIQNKDVQTSARKSDVDVGSRVLKQ